MDKERQRIINEAARIANNIDQIFIDAAYWNEHHPNQQPLDPDSDGQLTAWKAQMESLLANEAKLGNHPSVMPIKAAPRRYVPIELNESTRQMLLDNLDKN